MGKKTKKPGKGKEKTERKTAKAEEKRARRESKKVSAEDDIDAILVIKSICFLILHIQTRAQKLELAAKEYNSANSLFKSYFV